MERGILVHAAFAAFWRDIGDHATLVALAPDALATRVEAAAAAALDAIPSPRWRRLAPVVRAGEAARVASLVRRWLDGLERSRPPFAVAEMEAPRRLALGGLDLRLRLDRIDALADGGVAIIDYKTGLAKPPARWFDARPQGPQIGLYVLAERAFAPAVPVRGAAYAQLKPGELRVHGIAADAESWPGLAAPEGVRGANLADWSDAEAHWARSLGALATEVREGHAAVTPRDAPATCRHCGLQPLCRIGALADDDERGARRCLTPHGAARTRTTTLPASVRSTSGGRFSSRRRRDRERPSSSSSASSRCWRMSIVRSASSR